ncbi:amino acid adenylation domain-containing protein [Pantanalinema sp. GBBB05]|uniref:amino acid adenylation domain-containing protein n=1 Tax=Pantanalinema sp. GBBB05 TaxID=2604139 RepID=UPI001D7BBD8B|nr:amino acid adenylation domain-containing protein [Pantanalinema sp. GBBB05]
MTNRTITELVSHLDSLDVQLIVEGDRDLPQTNMRLRCTAPLGTLTPELRQELSDRKAELISYLHHSSSEDGVGQGDRQVGEPPVSPTPYVPGSSSFPLSFAQQRLWFLDQLAPGNPFYNVPAAIRLTGTLDQPVLERSFNEIVRRHAALRTTFTAVDGQPVQVIKRHTKVDLPVVNLSTVPPPEREQISQQLATSEAQRPFNLTTDSLLRLTLLQLSSTEAVLLLTLHHIVADGWSLGVLIRELADCYTAFVEGRSPDLSPLPIQYTDFVSWQRHWLQGEVLEQQMAYWQQQLQNLPVLQLPSDRPRPTVQTYQGATYPLAISPTLTQALTTLSQQAGTSLFMTLLAAFQTLLYRYTEQEDIAIGSPIANRHHSQVEGLIGFFVNSLVLRSDLSGNPTFRELLERVRTVALAAYEHQDLPFEKLVEVLDPDRDLSRNPLFQVAFALQNAPMPALELPGLTLEPAPLESSSTRFDLEVHLWEPTTHGLRSLWQSQAGLSGFIAYSTDLFNRDRIARLVEHFQTLLAGIAANPDAHLSNLPLLTPAERQQLLVAWNQPACLAEEHANGVSKLLSQQNLVGLPPDRYFHQIFAAQVHSVPDAIALVSEQGSLTYQELNQKAEQLAHTLHQMGVRSNELVGLCVDRSADMVIGLLGILKAGGAFVPLDPNYPSDRLHWMLTDTQVAILLTQSWLVAHLPAGSASVLCLDQPLPRNPKSRPTVPSVEKVGEIAQNSLVLQDVGDTPHPEPLAYVIYTSGSTGTPKGVLLSHRGLGNVVAAQQQVFHLSRNSRILQFASLSFDAAIFEVALALGSGGTLYIPPQSAQLPGIALVQFLQDNAITHALITPSVLAVLPPAELPALQVLITGGEVCSSPVIDRWAVDRHFFNAYGPTETTIWATVAELFPGDSPLTIGRPVLNTQIYILDANLNPVPVGIPGELYIGGHGLAQGYLHRPELTAERFIRVEWADLSSDDVPIHLKPKTLTLYKTGDRAQYRPDGVIEFLGRVDDQIKIRGFRVELGEIEATLQQHPAIQDAVVIASGATANEMRLVAYFSLDRQYFQRAMLPSLQTQQLQSWQTLYNQTYQTPRQTSPFNLTGWQSSYTGAPIPVEQMQEWVNDRVQQILTLQPQRVLEIGCGTGLLLFQIAPYCQTYVGTDFSAVALESIQSQLVPLNLPHVQLLHRLATDFAGIDPASFDVVILNSIVQYFPSQDYLMQVLTAAIHSVAPGGVLFIGDVRSLPLLTAFHTWVKFSQAEAGMERSQLQQQVDRSQFEEPELAIDPAFFDALRHQFPQIQQVQIRLSRGRSQNEMTQFRYNVLLHLKPSPSQCGQTVSPQQTELRASTEPKGDFNSIQHHDWKINPMTVPEVQTYLTEHKPECLVITNVTNSRVRTAVQTADWLCHKATPKTVGRMRELLQDATEPAIDPQDWWDLETQLPYTIEIFWSLPTHTGNYDVQLIRNGSNLVDSIVDLPIVHPLTQGHHDYTNEPLQANFARQLIPELQQNLRQILPDYMVPSAFVPLAKLPLTVNGKVDRVRMAAQSDDDLLALTTTPASSTIPLLTSTEVTLINVWKDLLRLKRVDIHDNFFELGGHSLLATQMTSRIRDAFGVELPLKQIFAAPTIAQLAPALETLRDRTCTSPIPPLIRLDRSAYRRKRQHLPDSQAQALSVPDSPLPDNASDSAHTVTLARSPLVPLTLGSRTSPFFCVHPMFGVVFPYLELAHHLGNDRSFYGLQPLGLDGKSTPLNRMDAIAAYYIQAIQTLQPHGPYFLGGWSLGGLVAFEMAQQLTQMGEQVALLAILDTPAPCHQLSLCQSLKFLLGTALWSTLPFLLDYGTLVSKRLQSRHPWFSRWQWSAIERFIPEASRLQLLDESTIQSILPIVYANAQATYRYTPKPYPHRITLFKAAEQPNAVGDNPTLGWNLLGSEIQLHEVPGNHLSLLKPPHVKTLAQQLQQCFAEFESAS